jgi:hypothetical protein
MTEFDSLQLRQHCSTKNYAMLKFEYTPWVARDLSIQAEVEWMSEHGGYKEPSLVRVEPDGTTSAIRHIIRGGIITEFLSRDQTLTRKSVYFGISALTLISWVVVTALGRRNPACVE